jgi:acetate---CoA ligase (ADP-forming)
MAPEGVEAVIGVQRDPTFGPVVMVGLGGILVEVLEDVAFRLAPFGVEEARRMIAELKGAKIFDGVRGAPATDVDALAELLAKVSVFAAAEADRIESVDLNPVRVLPKGQGVVALDALVLGAKT